MSTSIHVVHVVHVAVCEYAQKPGNRLPVPRGRISNHDKTSSKQVLKRTGIETKERLQRLR